MLRRVLLSIGLAACAAPPPPVPPAEPAAVASTDRVLFDGSSLGSWQVTSFGGEGPVEIEDGRMLLDFGSPLTGVTWAGEALPTKDYELEVEAARLSGSDFFCGLTFPVGDSAATLVLGGWGGSLCGVSSIDGQDASENETTRFLYLETGKRFRVRLRVTAERIQAWLDDAPLVDVAIAGRTIATRPEVAPSRPLGIASYATRAAIGPVRLRLI